MTITAGSIPTRGEDRYDVRCPKKLIVSTLQVLLAERRLGWDKELALMPVLQGELQTFRVKITAALNETYEAWRERDHDDLVLSMGMAGWYAEAMPAPLTDERVANLVLTRSGDKLAPVGDEKEEPAERPKSRAEMIASDWPELFSDDV